MLSYLVISEASGPTLKSDNLNQHHYGNASSTTLDPSDKTLWRNYFVIAIVFCGPVLVELVSNSIVDRAKTTPFYPQIKIKGVQIKIRGLQIKITRHEIEIRWHFNLKSFYFNLNSFYFNLRVKRCIFWGSLFQCDRGERALLCYKVITI